MGMGSFFKLPQYNVFDYKPRFYNPEAEGRKERRNQLREERGKTPAEEEKRDQKPGTSIKGSFYPKMPRTAYRTRSSTIRLFVIMAALFGLAYILLVVDISPVIKYFTQ